MARFFFGKKIRRTAAILFLLAVFPTTDWADEGDLSWKYPTGGYLHSSPAVAPSGIVYIGSYDNALYAVRPDGSLYWSFTTQGSVHSSPAVAADGSIYFGSNDGNLYALHSDGSLAWQFETAGEVVSSPVVGAEGTIYVGSKDGHLYALNPDGSERWRFATLDGLAIQSSPNAEAFGAIYFGCDDTYLYSVDSNGTLNWRFKTRSMIRSTPALGTDGTIYIGSYDNSLYAVSQGGQLQWEFAAGAGIHSSPAIGTDGTLYFGSYDSKLYAVNSDGSLRWSYTTGDGIFSSPCIGPDETVYVGSYDNSIYAVNPDGSLRWSVATGDRVLSSPTIDSLGIVYAGSRDASLYAIETTIISDIASPTVLETFPEAGATGIAVDTVVNVSFSEAIAPESATVDSFLLDNGEGAVSGSVAAAGSVLTFTPGTDLQYGTQYVATLTTAIVDLAGNAFSENYSWTFTTAPDLCPDDPAKIAPGGCGCGVPDVDSDGDQVLDCNDAFPDDESEWLDTDQDGSGNNGDTDDDNDGMPDNWEMTHGLNSLLDDAMGDPDGDGRLNLDEYLQGSDPFNAHPEIPATEWPLDGDSGVSLTPTLISSAFSDPDEGDSHAATDWQVATTSDFSILTLSLRSSFCLTELPVSDLILEGEQQYYWRVRYIDSANQMSGWSMASRFDTEPLSIDINADGIPSSLAVDESVDLDNDGTPDISQENMKSVNIIGGGGSAGVKTGSNVISVVRLGAVDPAAIAESADKPDHFPLGMIHFRLAVSPPGAAAGVTVYFSTTMPENAFWHQYDRITGWRNYSDFSLFSSRMQSISLTLQDGEYGDADGAVNGVIVSAGGCGLFEDILVDLAAGWNLISLHRLPADTAIESVLASIAGRYNCVWGYRGGAWRVFNPNAAGFSDLSVMEPGRGYWIDMLQDSVLSVPGGNTVNAIPLFSGWNLVGFNFPYARPAGEAMAGIEGGDVAVWGYEDSIWQVYDQINPGLSDLIMLEPKKGYWIYANQDCTWSIP